MEKLRTPALTVWYDGTCPLCLREIALMRRLDGRAGRIRFVDAADPAQSGFCPLDPAELLQRFHAQEVGRPVVSGAAAFAAMWRAIPILRPFGEMARLKPVLFVLEGLYVQFLRVRPRLQKLVSGQRR